MKLEVNGCKVSGNAKDLRELLDDNGEDSYLDNYNEESHKCEYCDFAKKTPTKPLLMERCKFNKVNMVGSITKKNYNTDDPELAIFATFPNIGYKETSFNINYCPICGRKLR